MEISAKPSSMRPIICSSYIRTRGMNLLLLVLFVELSKPKFRRDLRDVFAETGAQYERSIH